MRIAILVPMYKLVYSKSCYSLIRLIYFLKNHGFDSEFFGVDMTYIHDAREKLMRDFLKAHDEKEFDFVLHLDSDQSFSPDKILRLIKDAGVNDFDILSGVYFTKETGHVLPLTLMKNENGAYNYLRTFDREKEFYEVDAVGFGCLLVRPKVYLDLVREFDRVFEYKRDSDDKHLGEDMVFCEKVKELGYSVMVDRNVMIGHMGGEVTVLEHNALHELREKIL